LDHAVSRRRALAAVLAWLSGAPCVAKRHPVVGSMDIGQPLTGTPPADTLAVGISSVTKRLQVQAGGRIADFSVAELMDALGAK